MKKPLRILIVTTLALYLAVIALVVGSPFIPFQYFDINKDHDVILWLLFVIASGIFLSAVLFSFVTAGTWLYFKNKEKKTVSILMV